MKELVSVMRMIIKKELPAMVTAGVVTSVDREAGTCDVAREGKPELFNVRLNAVTESATAGITIYPAVGSNVLCVIINNDVTDAYMLASTEVDEVSVKVGESAFTIKDEGVTFNSGQIGGLVKANELVTQLEKLTARVDGIISAINNGVPVAQDGGAALQQSIKAQLELITDKENFGAIENLKVTH